jgi:hypothetical protein
LHRPADGPRKTAIESLQKQIDFHVAEANRLRYAQNSHTIISRLPAELLAETFLCVVGTGLKDGNSCFATGTFGFLRVCRHWNDVAVGFPRLWGWWVAGAVKAWPLFNSRSKGTPLCLVWRPRIHASARNMLIDPAIPERIRQLDFSGNSEQLEHLLGTFDSGLPSNASHIRLQISPRDSHKPQGHLARLLSSPLPKLSRLDLGGFLPDSSSSVFTTSSLTSLKLSFPYTTNNRHTLSQFSQILQQHPTLRVLGLKWGATPLPGPSETLVPFILPRLVDLRLYGKETDILRLIDLIDMSSPLHNVAVRFARLPDLTPSALATTLKKLLVAYYECRGTDHPRKINYLTISYNSETRQLAFNTRSRSTLTSKLGSNLKVQFGGIDELDSSEMVTEAFPILPLNGIQGFTAEGLDLYGDVCSRELQRMDGLSRLQLDNLSIWPVLDALTSDTKGTLKVVIKTTLNHPHAHRRIASTDRPRAGIIGLIPPRHPRGFRWRTFALLDGEARPQRWPEEVGHSLLPSVHA